ncbi:TetR/AcrR family transcriptional regulator [Streptosporangium lutulentum]
MASTDPRPLRADAQRNRDRLLDTAVRAFSQDGPDVTLDAIAKDAGVGIGTLYRHFPTREALIEAVYRNELTRLCDAATELLRTMRPDEATRTWMDRFVDYMTTKRGMADALRAVIASGGNPYAESLERLVAAITTLLQAAPPPGPYGRTSSRSTCS